MAGDAWQRLEALNRLTVAINASLDFGKIFTALEQHARALCAFDRVSFALLDPRQAGRMRLWGSADGAIGGELDVPLRGTLADVVRTRQPVVRRDFRPSSLDLSDPTDAAIVALGVRALVSLPLESEGELIGALTFSSRDASSYPDAQLPLLQQIAAQLALAVAKARLLGEERRRAEHRRLLNQVAQAVVSSLDEAAMLARVVELAHRVFDFVHLSAFVHDPATGTRGAAMRLVAVAGKWANDVPIGWRQPIDKGVIGRAVREARPTLVGDSALDPDYEPYPGIDSRTELVVPLIARGQVLGVLNAESDLLHAFDASDVETLTTIADQIAAGLTNAHLYAEVADMSRRLEEEVQRKTSELREANAEIARQKELLARENVHLRQKLARRGSDLIGQSPRLLEVLAVVDKVAVSHAPVLIQGESGTGKELVAARLHRLSGRAAGPYVSVNSGAFPENLLESELFGHEAGAFTGATARKPGLVEAAEGGTLFLDEIGEVAPQLQAKLLRFLQDGEYYLVGGQKPQRADVRIVTASNRDLAREVVAGRFREDLLFRINTITVELPPLRERREDIPALARYFLQRFHKGKRLAIGDLLMTALVHYPWPGNVRELANVIERLAILGEEGELGLEFLPSHIVAEAARAPEVESAPRAAAPRLRDLEREHILRTLAKHGGDKTKTARELGIALKTLYNKLDRYRRA